MPGENSSIAEAREHRVPAARGPAILQIVPRLDAGGAERSAVDIAAALAREGYTPLVASAGGRMVAELVASGGEWLALPVDSKSPLALYANARRLQNLIRTRNISLVHARSRAPAWSALIATRRERVPFVTTYHGAYSTESALKRFYNSAMLRGDAVIANSEWTARQIRTQYGISPRRLVTIRRGVDLERFDPSHVARQRIEALRKAWGAREEETIVLLPGRFTRRKGQLVALEALAGMESRGNVRLVLAGDAEGAYGSEVEQAIGRLGLNSHVVIAGHVDDMPAAVCASDIVISVSSEPEAFGRVAAEAGAMGRAVIVADHGGAREIVLAGISGHLVPPGNPRALAAALSATIAAGREARAVMGTHARAHISRNFTLARMAAETLALYRDLLGPERISP